LSRLGKREGNPYLVTQARSELTLIEQFELNRGALLPWFLLTSTNPTFTAAVPTYTLPATFLREWDEAPLSIDNGAGANPRYSVLEKGDFDLLASKYGFAAGKPRGYSLMGDVLQFFGVPDVNYTGLFWHYASPTPLSDATQDNAWTLNASDLLIAKLGVVMARYAKASDMIGAFQQDEVRAWSRIQTEDIARKNAAYEAFRGDADG